MSQAQLIPNPKGHQGDNPNPQEVSDFFTLRHIPRRRKDSSIGPTTSLKIIDLNLQTLPPCPPYPKNFTTPS